MGSIHKTIHVATQLSAILYMEFSQFTSAPLTAIAPEILPDPRKVWESSSDSSQRRTSPAHMTRCDSCSRLRGDFFI